MSATYSHAPGTAADIENVLGRVNRYWRRTGAPRRERQRQLSALHDHLEAEVAAGHDVRGVIGTDLTAFAAGWIQAGRSHRWLDALLRCIAAFVPGCGLIALLGPVAFGLDGFAIQGQSFAFPVAGSLALLGFDIARMHRARLTGNTAHLIAGGGVVTGGLVGGLLITVLGEQVIAEFSALTIVLVLVLGAGCNEASRRIRLASRPPPRPVLAAAARSGHRPRSALPSLTRSQR